MTTVCMGELLIDFVSTESGVEVGQAPAFVKAAGGAPANVAVALARIGEPSAFLGMVGDDPFGHYLAGVLAAEGVDVRGLKFNAAARTMLAFVSNAADGERSFTFYRHPSADMLMTPRDVALEVIDAAQVFHFGSITLIDEPARSATLAAVRRAQDSGLLISYDPNLRLALWQDEPTARAGLLSGFEYAHLVKVSAEEVVFLTGGDDVTPLWREHTRAIVVTMGKDGSRVHLRHGSLERAGRVVQAVDTTGAGDAFVAGVLRGILRHPDRAALFGDVAPWDDILRFANSIGALATTQRGAIPSLPTLEQVLAFMA